MIYIVIIHGVEVEYQFMADAVYAAYVNATVVFFRTHEGGYLFEL